MHPSLDRFLPRFAALAGVLSLAACNASSLEASADLGGGAEDATSGGATGAAGTGSSGGGGSIDFAPDAGDRDASTGLTSYATYCGSGTPCTPGSTGEATSCNGGSPGAGGAGGGGSLSCQLVPGGDGPVATCGVPGPGAAGTACATASDCTDGLGCVAPIGTSPPSAGQCRDYCCGDPEACPESTYCALQVLADPTAASTIDIPACVPVTPCQLLSDEGQCPAGTACTIVREDGTTSCVEPGHGKECEPCACAAGFVCSAAMNQCKKLCHTTAQYGNECGDGFCQGGIGNLPDGIGVCSTSGC